jgi:hypothetical protein
MKTTRSVLRVGVSQPTIEGAGVHLRRAFGFTETPAFDPFLLLDDFRSDDPRHYLKGFPWHPHRGIETITYVLSGSVAHGDSLGNRGVIGAGDVQWMTAGSGIIHQEMPQGDAAGRMGGFQLWANLPAAHKMMDPRYRDVTHDQIPQVTTAEGVTVRVICGEACGTRGPVQDIVTEPQYLDIAIPAGVTFAHPTAARHTVFAYVIEGQCDVAPGVPAGNGTLVLFGDGDEVVVQAAASATRLLLVSGRPIGEPIAWHGPIVMNTQQELEVAFREYRDGTFIKHG